MVTCSTFSTYIVHSCTNNSQKVLNSSTMRAMHSMSFVSLTFELDFSFVINMLYAIPGWTVIHQEFKVLIAQCCPSHVWNIPLLNNQGPNKSDNMINGFWQSFFFLNLIWSVFKNAKFWMLTKQKNLSYVEHLHIKKHWSDMYNTSPNTLGIFSGLVLWNLGTMCKDVWWIWIGEIQWINPLWNINTSIFYRLYSISHLEAIPRWQQFRIFTKN